MAELFNEARVLVKSRKLNIDKKSVKPKLGKKKREVHNDEGHFTTESTAGEVSFKLAVDKDYDADEVDSWVDVPVQVEDINMGLTFQSEGMTTLEQGAPDKGFVEVKMGGKPLKRLK
jgi:hypothetical protein